MSSEQPYSHPEQNVRHSYPLTIENAGFFTAFGLLQRTLPYALMRFAILLTVSVVTIIWFSLTFGGFAFLANHHLTLFGYPWLIGGLGVYGYVWFVVVRYGLYLIKCGHIAVLTELITTNGINHGAEGMFSYGKRIVTERFGQVNILFALDVLVEGVVRAFNRTLDFIGALLPIPGLSSVLAIVNAVIYAATTYIDETIFSYNLARGDENPWRSSKDGLIYYCQNVKEVMKTAVFVVILDKVLTFFAWIVMLVPAGLVTAILPNSAKGGGGAALFFIAVLFAINVRSAFLKPLFLIMIMTKFHVCARNQEINLSWEAKLESVSSKFRKIKDGIASWNPVRPAPAPQPSA